LIVSGLVQRERLERAGAIIVGKTKRPTMGFNEMNSRTSRLPQNAVRESTYGHNPDLDYFSLTRRHRLVSPRQLRHCQARIDAATHSVIR
jgi:hypothetical protein